MNYISTKEAAEKWKVSENTVVEYCKNGLIVGAVIDVRGWIIPEGSVNPKDRMRRNIWTKLGSEVMDKKHAKDPNKYSLGKLTITACDEDNLYEMTLVCIKTLNDNGGWDCVTEWYRENYKSIITFKYNGNITAFDAIGKLKNKYESATNCTVSWEFVG